ncbi:MAG: glycosyltransferase family 2 protein [Pseudomonadota bacterium]
MLTVVSPVYRARDCVDELCQRLTAACANITDRFEVILVDDACPENSWELIERQAERDERIKGIRLVRNFGQHHAVTAGLDHARGEWVVVMDCDLQEAPEEIPRLYAKATEEGHLCVMARRTERKDNWFKTLQSKLFYRLFSYLTDLKELNGTVTNFGIAHRQVIDQIVGLREASRFYPGFLFWLGYPTAFVEVQHHTRFAGDTSYTFLKLLQHSRDIILAYSTKPLTLCVMLGAIVATGAFLTGTLYFFWVLLFGTQVTGWPSLMITLLFSVGILVTTLGMVGLYVGRVLVEVKGRPIYVIRKSTFDA